jgi:hypothetical protein
MSGCHCDSPQEFRITGEVWNENMRHCVGPGEKTVRVRCGCCGGKVGLIGSDVLTELFQIEPSDIKNGRCLSREEYRHIQVDLV